MRQPAATLVIDVLDRCDLPIQGSLREFQRLFPDEAACTPEFDSSSAKIVNFATSAHYS
jgi:hypothetical protein